MKAVFDRVARECKQRKTLNARIEEQVALINLNKIAIIGDLDRCLWDHGSLSEKRYKNFHVYHDRLEKAARFLLPNTLIKTAAKESEEKRREFLLSHPEVIASRRKTFERRAITYGLIGRALDVDAEIEEYINPKTFIAYYVGDFMDALDCAINLKKSFTLSALLYGDGAKTLELVTNLRHVPDYSHHFPNRPPSNGKGNKRKEDAPQFAIPGLPVPSGG